MVQWAPSATPNSNFPFSRPKRRRSISFGERIYELRGSIENSEFDPFKRARKLEEPILPKIKPKFLRKDEYIEWLREAVGYTPPVLRDSKPSVPSRPKLSDSEREAALDLIRETSDAVVCVLDKVELRQRDFNTLNPGSWLNDEIINSYIKLLVNSDIPLKVHAFSTFFWAALSSFEPNSRSLSYDYAKVKRWTRRQKVDVFEKDVIVIPVNVGQVHWTLGCLDMRSKEVRFYDSMGVSSNPTFNEFMLRYIQDEYKDKKSKDLPDFAEWKAVDVYDNPQQDNGYDCGVFLCKYAECIVNDKVFDFSQSDIENCRLCMALELYEGKARKY